MNPQSAEFDQIRGSTFRRDGTFVDLPKSISCLKSIPPVTGTPGTIFRLCFAASSTFCSMQSSKSA